jgi:hypothetical protein
MSGLKENDKGRVRLALYNSEFHILCSSPNFIMVSEENETSASAARIGRRESLNGK